jgi:hypothetical protein
MSKIEIDINGMPLLEIVKAYPELIVEFIEQHNKKENVEFLTAMLAIMGEYQSSIGLSNSQLISILELITWLEEKLSEAEKALVEPATEGITNYDTIKDRVTEVLPKFYLGQEVYAIISGRIEKGILVKLEMPFNGLYISPERAECLVWFSTDSKNGWVTHEFKLTEIAPVVKRQEGIFKLGVYVESTGCFKCQFYSSHDPCTLSGGPAWKEVYTAWREGGFAIGCPLTNSTNRK